MMRSDFTRWLYRGQRPNWIARMLNRAWAAAASSGVASNYLVTLEVTGRKSGRTVSLPLVVAFVDGQRYLVSMLGERVHWVHNVRAAGGRAVLRSGGREKVHLEEVPSDQRAPILRAYLQRAPGARPHLPVNKDAPLAEFEKVAAAFPIFRVMSNAHADPEPEPEQREARALEAFTMATRPRCFERATAARTCLQSTSLVRAFRDPAIEPAIRPVEQIKAVGLTHVFWLHR